MLCVVGSGGVGRLCGWPQIRGSTQDTRLAVLGDSFASPMAESPHVDGPVARGRIRAWRVQAKLNASPLRLLDTGPDVFQLNDPLEQGCYAFETDRGGVHLGFLSRPMDLRVTNGASGRQVFNLQLESLESGSLACNLQRNQSSSGDSPVANSGLNAVPLTSLKAAGSLVKPCPRIF